jgi:hypothetical protein
VLGATWHSYSGPSFPRDLARAEQWPCADTTPVLFPLRAVRCRTHIALLQLRSEPLSSASGRRILGRAHRASHLVFCTTAVMCRREKASPLGWKAPTTQCLPFI